MSEVSTTGSGPVPVTTSEFVDVSVTVTTTVPVVKPATEYWLYPGTSFEESSVLPPDVMLTLYVVMPLATRTTT
jgi:hypothetical protein